MRIGPISAARCRGFLFVIAAFWSVLLVAENASAELIQLQNEAMSVQCDASRMELHLTPVGRSEFVFVSDWSKSERIEALEKSSEQASWRVPERDLTVKLRLEKESLFVEFVASEAGVLGWPTCAPGTNVHAWVLPLFEGVYIPSDDARWQAHLVKESPMNTTAGLTLPFWGFDAGDFTLTCQLLNPFNNELQFDAVSGRLCLRCTHEFARNNEVKQFGMRFTVGPASPIEPAREYRRWLQSRGEFVSLADKVKRTPEVAKLFGAAHVYLWGEGPLSVDDVKDWKGFARKIQQQGGGSNAAPAWQIWQAIGPEAQKSIGEIIVASWPDRYNKSVVVTALNQALVRKDLFAVGAASEEVVCRVGREYLAAHFGEFLKPMKQWGEGISPQMIRELAAAGLDRLWLGTPGWEGFVRQPETVKLARDKGYLIATYDSYHSIHSPQINPDETWATAQFDQELYDAGAIVNADGKPRKGFKQRGFMLSPKAARPWVERRVSALVKIFPANSWFLDCDGFGEFFDDYSPMHPATQASDFAERMSRSAWIRDTYGAVIGSEGCFAGAAATLHFTHGVLTPVIGWGDPDLTAKSSKYYFGSYYPPNEPAVFFKPVPLKEGYRYLFYDVRFRLPLFETVFHDSVVATHHWSNPSMKFPEVAGDVELLELLYEVPPLYHLNRVEFAKRKAEIKRHYDFFSPLNRELAGMPMTDFRWKTENRLVQSVAFGNIAEITVNFSKSAYSNAQSQIPAGALQVSWKNGKREPMRFRPVKTGQ